MKLFVIHRFRDRKLVKVLFKKSGKEINVKFDLVLLDGFGCKNWKDKATESISQSEVSFRSQVLPGVRKRKMGNNKGQLKRYPNCRYRLQRHSGHGVFEIETTLRT
jgi:hypothetical protein